MNDYMPSIKLEVSPPDSHEGFRTITFVGDLDKAGLDTVSSQIEEIEAGLDENENYLVFDFGALNFINSEGIGFLLKIHYRLVKRDKKLVIVSPLDHVKDVLEVIGFMKIVDHYGSLDEFEKNV